MNSVMKHLLEGVETLSVAELHQIEKLAKNEVLSKESKVVVEVLAYIAEKFPGISRVNASTTNGPHQLRISVYPTKLKSVCALLISGAAQLVIDGGIPCEVFISANPGVDPQAVLNMALDAYPVEALNAMADGETEDAAVTARTFLPRTPPGYPKMNSQEPEFAPDYDSMPGPSDDDIPF